MRLKKQMRKIVFVVTVICCFVNMRCEPSDDLSNDIDDLLIGNWANPEYSGENITLKRVDTLPDNSYGISFESKGKFMERTSGWLATPPFYFIDYEGEYTLTESEISIMQEHFPNNYTLRILSLNENELVLVRVLTEQEKDYRSLMNKFDEAIALIKEIPCDNEANWTFTSYGSKACGGPQGYVAYPINADADIFLEKINVYTQAERDYNIKWSVFSTCDLPQEPNTVSCQDGYPVLKY